MNNSRISEKDWKIIRSMKDNLLNVACSRILKRIYALIKNEEESAHEIYLQLWKTMRDEDKEISICFDDIKRSNAVFKASVWKRNGLISDDQIKRFSDETQQRIRNIEELW